MSDCDLLADHDLETLKTRRHGRKEFRLLRDLHFEDIVVPAGFVTDRYSLPGRLVPAIWQPQQNRFATPAVIHDWLFETKLRSFADANSVFARAMKACGVKWHHRQVAYAAVSLFGRSGYGLIDPDNVELVRPWRNDVAVLA